MSISEKTEIFVSGLTVGFLIGVIFIVILGWSNRNDGYRQAYAEYKQGTLEKNALKKFPDLDSQVWQKYLQKEGKD
jgi:hypothetical protein